MAPAVASPVLVVFVGLGVPLGWVLLATARAVAAAVPVEMVVVATEHLG